MCECTPILDKITAKGQQINELCKEKVIIIDDWEEHVAMARLKRTLNCN